MPVPPISMLANQAEREAEIRQGAGCSVQRPAYMKCWSLASKKMRGSERGRRALPESAPAKMIGMRYHRGGYFRGV